VHTDYRVGIQLSWGQSPQGWDQKSQASYMKCRERAVRGRGEDLRRPAFPRFSGLRDLNGGKSPGGIHEGRDGSVGVRSGRGQVLQLLPRRSRGH
jgi:hypothetical protein